MLFIYNLPVMVNKDFHNSRPYTVVDFVEIRSSELARVNTAETPMVVMSIKSFRSSQHQCCKCFTNPSPKSGLQVELNDKPTKASRSKRLREIH